MDHDNGYQQTLRAQSLGIMGTDIWIGLVHVLPDDLTNALGGLKGAYVHAVALVADETQFMEAVGEAVQELGLSVHEVEALETASERLENSAIGSELLELAEDLTELGDVRLGTFHSYDIQRH